MSKVPIFVLIVLCSGFVVPAAHAQNTVPTHPVDGEYINEWLVLGPFFPDSLEEDFLGSVGGEANIHPQEGDTVTTTEGRTLTWKRYQAKGSIIDLLHAVGNHEHAIAYAFCTLQIETAGKVQISFGSDDNAVIWINGQRVGSVHRTGAIVLDQYLFDASLKAGTNRCLVKVSQIGGPWDLAVRVFPHNQPVSVTPKYFLSADAMKNDKTIRLSGGWWKYHPGDNPRWASPELDDSSWETVDTWLAPKQLPKGGWTGIGWFRLHLAVDAKLWNVPLALSVSQLGASEIYLDGNRIYQSGKVGASKAEEEAYWEQEPRAISFGGRTDHVLAVRYSNLSASTFVRKIKFDGRTGFEVLLRNLNQAIQQRAREIGSARMRQVFLATVPLVFAFMHLLLFLFERRSPANLYYAISVSCFAVGIFSYFQSDFATTPAQFGFYMVVFGGGMVVSIVFGLFVAYSESYAFLPKRSLVFLPVGVGLVIWCYVRYDSFISLLLSLFFPVVLIEIVRTSISTRRKKGNQPQKTGIQFVTFGLALFVLSFIYEMLLVFNLISPVGGVYIPSIIYGFLCLIISISIDLAREFAQTNADNARMATELEITERIQRMILPSADELKSIPELDIAGYMQPADDVGGDYYDVQQREGTVAISIGDVTGHGLESGLVMLMTQTAVQALLQSGETDPVHFLDTLNRTIYNNVQRMDSDKNLTLCLLDYQSGELKLSGQHEEMIVVRRDGQVELIDTIDLGFPIGLDDDIAAFIDQTTVQLHEGDGVVLYTDGITEAENTDGEQYGLERLCEVVSQHWSQSAEEIKEAVIVDVRGHIGGQEVYDDITLVVMKQK